MIAAAAGSQAWGGPAGRPPQSLVVGHGLGPGPGPGPADTAAGPLGNLEASDSE